jgi:NADH:ubiquinone oxidoreductase subunit 6 (subunit J)
MLWSRILCVIGLAMMPIAVAAYVLNSTTPPYSSWLLPGMTAFGTVVYIFNGFDPRSPWLLLTGLTLPGSGLVARGAFLGKSRYRKFLYAALVLIVCGLIAGFTVLAITFMNQSDVPNPWWAFVTYAYPIGVIMSCVGAVLVIVESFRRPLVPKDGVEPT